MKGLLIFALIALTLNANAQKKVKIKLTNAVVIGQIDKPAERYALEGALTGLLAQNGIKSAPSLNFVKVGGDTQILASDSVMTSLKDQGFDTYCIVNVRGYDRKFKASVRRDSLIEKLGQGSLFELYRQEAVSVTFEFTFYRNGEFVKNDIIKLGNISDRDSVLKRFNKKMDKFIYKNWR